MIKQFEIKSHDGPGRVGKVDGELTPRIFFKEELKIAPNQEIGRASCRERV